MPPDLRSSSEKGDHVLSYLRSEEFSDLIANIVPKQTRKLVEAVDDLRNEVTILKECNSQLINLLSQSNIKAKPFINQVIKPVNCSDSQAKTFPNARRNSEKSIYIKKVADIPPRSTVPDGLANDN
jgi:hypothetical protein